MTDPLIKIREAALELPETEERLSHGQPTFFVAGKQFAQFRNDHHGDGKTVVCVRVSGLDEQAMLLEADPKTYSKPAYMPTWLSITVAGEDIDATLVLRSQKARPAGQHSVTLTHPDKVTETLAVRDNGAALQTFSIKLPAARTIRRATPGSLRP